MSLTFTNHTWFMYNRFFFFCEAPQYGVGSGFNGPELFHVSVPSPCAYRYLCFRYHFNSNTADFADPIAKPVGISFTYLVA